MLPKETENDCAVAYIHCVAVAFCGLMLTRVE